jgi:hypothetical protein
VLKLGYRYDLTTVSLVHQLPDAIVAARAKARQEVEDKARREVEDWLRAPMVVLGAAAAQTTLPIPIPETADKPTFDRAKGDLKFESTSGVRELAAFYRVSLKHARLQGSADRHRQ